MVAGAGQRFSLLKICIIGLGMIAGVALPFAALMHNKPEVWQTGGMEKDPPSVVSESEKIVPYCAKKVAIISKENENHLVFRGDLFETVKIKGSFQVSEKDATEVAGTLTLKNPPVSFEESGDYEWQFIPDDGERFANVTGMVHLTAVRNEFVRGIEEVLGIEDKASLYKVALTDCGLNDLSILEGAINLKVLDVCNTDDGDDANDNHITDISLLADCRYLEQFYIDNNRDFKDISPLLKLKKLKSVVIGNTSVSDEDKEKLAGLGIEVKDF